MIVKNREHYDENAKLELIETIYDSSNILMSTYFPKSEKLYIAFNKGAVYQYLNCSKELFLEFKTSESQGKFFNQNIKNNKDLIYSKHFDLYNNEIEHAKSLVKEWKESKQASEKKQL